MSADIDAAGLALARAQARRDSLSPEGAAKAAGARTRSRSLPWRSASAAIAKAGNDGR
jgi:hypothetical protein